MAGRETQPRGRSGSTSRGNKTNNGIKEDQQRKKVDILVYTTGELLSLVLWVKTPHNGTPRFFLTMKTRRLTTALMKN
jgi:hypothetical protein